MTSFYTYMLLALGGAFGACLRYYLTQESIKWFGKGFPFGILALNVVGSFLLGLLYTYCEQHESVSQNVKLFIGVGILGSLTTFSTFSYETLVLFNQSEYLKALLNVGLNVGLCLFGVWLAFLLVKG